MAEERILPPFPDELVERPRKEAVLEFLSDLQLPRRIARVHLKRWSDVTGIAVTESDVAMASFRRNGSR